MVHKRAVRTLALTLVLLLFGNIVFATPTPPYLLVNHATEECAESILGDDCSWCDPPPGWEVVGLSSANRCPEGYRRLERVDLVCRRYETPFCCSGGGHQGDCENMVVHDGEGSCTFVEDVETCVLPPGWRTRPADVDPARWSCPMDYRWVDAIDCLSGEPQPSTSDPESDTSPGAATVLVAVGLAALAVYVVARLILVFKATRSRRR